MIIFEIFAVIDLRVQREDSLAKVAVQIIGLREVIEQEGDCTLQGENP
jgi:hypothetical protein